MPSRLSRPYFIVGVTVIGFLFHLVWEYLQCSPLFIHLKVEPTHSAMIYATLGDVVILWSSYLVVAAFRKSFFWPWYSSSLISWALLVSISMVTAGVIEYFAISRQLWAYSSINPTVYGISIVPLFQMAILNPLTLLITKKFLA